MTRLRGLCSIIAAMLAGVVAFALPAMVIGHTNTQTFGDGDNCSSATVGHDHVDEFHLRGGADCAFGYGDQDVLDGGDGWDGVQSPDALSGGNDGDRIEGGPGDDDVRGDGGNDNLFGDGDHDLVHGDGGNDDVDGGSGPDAVEGDGGLDDMRGSVGGDIVRGADGQANETVNGGDGDDDCTVDSTAGYVSLDNPSGCETVTKIP